MTDFAAALAKRFAPLERDTSSGLVLEIYGPPGSGKTDLALRGPLPVVHFGFDYHGARRPTERIFAQYPERVGATFPHTYKLRPRDRKADPDEVAQKETLEDVLKPFLSDYEYAIDNGARTLIIDTFDMFKEAQIIAKFGKLESNAQLGYGEINAQTSRLVHIAREANAVLVLITRMKEEYKEVVGSNGKPTSKSTGKLIPASNVRVGHTVDAQLETSEVGGVFSVKIVKAKTNMSENGRVLESPDFPTLASLIKPQVDFAVWE